MKVCTNSLWIISIIMFACTLLISGCNSPNLQQQSDSNLENESKKVLALSYTNDDLVKLIGNYSEECDSDPTQELGSEFATEYPNWLAWFAFLYFNCSTNENELMWEQWGTNVGVYQPDGEAPPPWGSSELTDYVLVDSAEISGHRLSTVNGRPILYEIRMNEATYDYIVGRQLYNKDCQINFFQGIPCDGNNSSLNFPPQSIEIKTAWVILQENDPSNNRYYSISTSYVDPNGNEQDVIAGLAGFHISSKILPNWLWATFEQIDNAAVIGEAPIDPIPDDVQTINVDVRQHLATAFPDLPWQYYQLRGTQIDYVDDNGNPIVLANTLIESDFQTSSSCMTCHALSTRGSLPQGRLAFFDINDEGMQGYIGDPIGQNYYDSFENPVCYTGISDYFTDCNSNQNIYRQLDFVWSLREAN